MRLLKVSDQKEVDDLPTFVDFPPDRIPPYAILSHRWNAAPSEEVLFQDLVQARGTSSALLRRKQGYRKFHSSCLETRKHGLDYLWIDTCCIDKSSSAELSEAINTMYEWYNKAQVCFAYLADVPATVNLTSDDSELTRTEWATRGWTLQELLAPREMIFYSGDWQKIGTKESLSGILSLMTGIDEAYLTKEGSKNLWSASIAKRMSWAARRETSRPEDIAYCLMGLFQVNMPMLYGEGERAFTRLQEEIMKHSDDHSLFAWTEEDQSDASVHGLLAKHPRCFKRSGSIMPYEDREIRAPFSMSNRGLCIELHLTKLDADSIYAAALDCPVPPRYDDASFLAIYLKKLPFSHGQYARVKVGAFGQARQRGRLETIYVRQSIVVPDIRGVFPTHIFQLRKFTSPGEYRVVQTIPREAVSETDRDSVQAVKTTQHKGWMPPKSSAVCKITSKGEKLAQFAVHIVFADVESVIILLGTVNLHVGFNVVQTPDPELSDREKKESFSSEFIPLEPGSSVVIGYHRVHVSAEPLVSNNSKYYMVDFQVDALARPQNLIEEIFDTFDDLMAPEPLPPTHDRRTVMQRLKRPFGVKRVG